MTHVLIDRATLEQALAALEGALDDNDFADALSVSGGVYEGLQCKDSIKALRSALANAEPAGWIAVSDRLPLEADGEVLVRMRDGRHEIAWATYWHGANTGFAEWTFRDQDEDETPTHWMPILKEQL